MPLPDYSTWHCTRRPAKRSAPCGTPICPGFLCVSQDFKAARVDCEKAAADALVRDRNRAEAQEVTSDQAVDA